MIRMWHVIVFMTIFILLSDQGQQRGELKRMKNDHFKYFFYRLGHFDHVFGQFKWIILNFAAIITFVSLVLCQIVFFTIILASKQD